MEEEVGALDLADGRIGYTVRRNSRSRRIRIAVYPEGDVVVRCPTATPSYQIDRFVRKNAAWLERSLEKMRNEPRRLIRLGEGATIPLFGNDYTVVGLQEGGSGAVRGNFAYFSNACFSEERAGKALLDFYRLKLQHYLMEHVTDYERITGLTAESYGLKVYRSKWGSCSPEDRITFNVKLAAFPVHVVDYVIFHELCHIRYKNHSKSFWNLVSRYVDDLPFARKELRLHARGSVFG